MIIVVTCYPSRIQVCWSWLSITNESREAAVHLHLESWPPAIILYTMHIDAYTCFRWSTSRYTMRIIAVHTRNDLSQFRVIFQCLSIHAYLSHYTTSWSGVKIERTVCPFLIFFLVYSVHTSSIYYIPYASWYISCFHIDKDKSVISCCRAVCWCLIMPAFILHAQHSLSCSQKWKKQVCWK